MPARVFATSMVVVIGAHSVFHRMFTGTNRHSNMAFVIPSSAIYKWFYIYCASTSVSNRTPMGLLHIILFGRNTTISGRRWTIRQQ